LALGSEALETSEFEKLPKKLFGRSEKVININTIHRQEGNSFILPYLSKTSIHRFRKWYVNVMR
jgi:hypothetical protein